MKWHTGNIFYFKMYYPWHLCTFSNVHVHTYTQGDAMPILCVLVSVTVVKVGQDDNDLWLMTSLRIVIDCWFSIYYLLRKPVYFCKIVFVYLEILIVGYSLNSIRCTLWLAVFFWLTFDCGQWLRLWPWSQYIRNEHIISLCTANWGYHKLRITDAYGI